ncbi:MAG: DUF1570 domain-containing protein [Gemmataceae bacterium]
MSGSLPRLLPLALLLAGLSGCNVFPLSPNPPLRAEKETVPGLPDKHLVRVGQFVFFSDFEIARGHALFKELGALREQVTSELKLPSASQAIFVYVFEDKDHFERFMQSKYPDFPRRRAFFVAQPRRLGGTEDLLVYTFWGDRVTQDLRHELTHALLHSVLKDVPLWLDEGLAEFFEVPTGWKGINYQHLDLLLRGPEAPAKLEIDRLEQLIKVNQMAPGEYREAWAWTHWMLRGNAAARKTLLAYIQELRTNPNPGPLGPRLARVVPDMSTAAQRHMVEMDRTRKPAK